MADFNFFYPVFFLFGLVIGSFLNCLIYRLTLPTFSLKSFGLKSRSYCPDCKHTLNWKDLIPVFSFIFLKGRCRYCNKKISFQYPIVEISTGLIFLFIFNLKFEIFNQFSIFNFINLCFLLLVSCFLIIIFVCDLKHFIIPDRVIFPLIGIVFLYRFSEFLSLNHWKLLENWKLKIENLALFNYLFAALGASLFFLIIFLISRGNWLGFGDVKLAFFMGFFLGFPRILVALFFAFMIGAIIGIGLILAKTKTLKSEIPFGPFLVAGTFIALFWGEEIIRWYINFII
jgi:leader peptidase (prepilin peptidase)/N-methyltransferase